MKDTTIKRTMLGAAQKLDGVLALHKLVKKTKKSVSKEATVRETQSLWQRMSLQQRIASTVVARQQPLCNVKYSPKPVECEWEELDIVGPEPNKNAKISIPLKEIVQNYKRSTRGQRQRQREVSATDSTSGSSDADIRCIQRGKKTLLYRESQLSVRANAVLSNAQVREQLITQLRTQRVPLS